MAEKDPVESMATCLMSFIRENELINAVDLGVWLFSPRAEESLEAFLLDKKNVEALRKVAILPSSS